MRDVLDTLINLLDSDGARPVVLARVVSTTGSAPRDVGAAMLITADGEIVGSLSGGCVESAVAIAAEDVLTSGAADIQYFGVTDLDAPADFAIGLTCGGEIEVFLERVDAARLDQLRLLAAAIDAGQPVAWATTLQSTPEWQVAPEGSDQPWRRLDHDVADLRATGRSGIVGVNDCDEPNDGDQSRPRTFVQTFAPQARLILVGANDFVRALSSVGSSLGYRVSVVDARPVFATATRFPDADEVVVEWPDHYLARQLADGLITTATCVCVMTHDAKFDVPTLRVALSDKRIGFVGALGSRRTVADRNDRLRDAGVTREQLARLRSPIGLDLGGRTPTEVAVAIAAQLIADRHSASGEPLFRGSGPIH